MSLLIPGLRLFRRPGPSGRRQGVPDHVLLRLRLRPEDQLPKSPDGRLLVFDPGEHGKIGHRQPPERLAFHRVQGAVLRLLEDGFDLLHGDVEDEGDGAGGHPIPPSNSRKRRVRGKPRTSFFGRLGFIVWSFFPRPVVSPRKCQFAAR